MSFFLCHEHSDRRTKATSHQKVKIFQWIIQFGFDSFFLDLVRTGFYMVRNSVMRKLKQKSDKIEQNFFPPMHIPFRIAILFVQRINLCKPRIISLLSCTWFQRQLFAGVYEIRVSKSFAKFTGKQLRWSLV